jgi:hypothetical protein
MIRTACVALRVLIRTDIPLYCLVLPRGMFIHLTDFPADYLSVHKNLLFH